MKKFFLALLLAFNYAQATDSCNEIPCFSNNNNFYAEVFGGANFLQTESRGSLRTHYRTGYIVSGSLGYRWCYGLRLEAEYAFRKNTVKRVHFFGRSFNLHGHFESSSYMANLLWDLPLSFCECDLWNIRPFVGGGVGYDNQRTHAKILGTNFHKNKKHFSWQIIAGLGYPIFCNTDISVEYKFHKGGFKHIYNHSLGIGLTYSFGI